MDVYIPHTTFPVLPRVISSNDITEFFEIPGTDFCYEYDGKGNITREYTLDENTNCEM
jgi:hypothetical protein